MKVTTFSRMTIVLALALAACQVVDAELIRLGAAETLGIFAWGWGTKLDLKNPQSGLYGCYGLGPQAIQQFTTGFITDGYCTDPRGYDSHPHSVTTAPDGRTFITPETVDLEPAQADVLAASEAFAALTATQAFGDVDSALTITRTTDINVIDLNSIDFTGSGDVLTLQGGPGDYFVVNIGHVIRLSDAGSAIQVAGGLPASHVIFNITSDGFLDGLSAQNGASLIGTYLVTSRGVLLSNCQLDGAIMAGNDIHISGGAVVRQNTFLPEPAPLLMLLLAASAVLARIACKAGER